MYNVDLVKREQIILLKESCDLRLTNITGPVLDMDHFISQQSLRIKKSKPHYRYDLNIKFEYLKKEIARMKWKSNQRIDAKATLTNVNNVFNSAIALNLILLEYELKKRNLIYIKVFCFTLTLMCWIYILIKSFPTLPQDAFDWLHYFIPQNENTFI